MGFDRVDVLDALALYPERREHGMTRAELMDDLVLDDSEANRLSKLLTRLCSSGYVRQAGSKSGTSWFITDDGMSVPGTPWANEPETEPAREWLEHVGGWGWDSPDGIG